MGGGLITDIGCTEGGGPRGLCTALLEKVSPYEKLQPRSEIRRSPERPPSAAAEDRGVGEGDPQTSQELSSTAELQESGSFARGSGALLGTDPATTRALTRAMTALG